MFKALNLFKTNLISSMETTDTTLPISASMATTLCTLINDGECTPCGSEEDVSETNFTRLVIYHSGYSEIVKVTGCSGNVPTIEREQEGTSARKFPVGACVQFIWTAANVQCAITTVVNGDTLSDFAEDCPDVTIP